MGLCASCLGLNRHPSHKTETDRLLNSRATSHYDAISNHESAAGQLDEEDAQIEREVLEEISARAAEHMIDVLRTESSATELHRETQPLRSAEGDEEADLEDAEQAWLQDLPVNELDQDVAVKGSYAGNLVIDMSQLREQNGAAARRVL